MSSAKARKNLVSNRGKTNFAYMIGPRIDPWIVPSNRSRRKELPPSIELHPNSYFQGKNLIKEGIVIYNSLKLDLGNNLAWPNSLKGEL